MTHYVCSKCHCPVGLLGEIYFLLALLTEEVSPFLWNFQALTQGQHPPPHTEMTRTKENTADGATSINGLVLCPLWK